MTRSRSTFRLPASLLLGAAVAVFTAWALIPPARANPAPATASNPIDFAKDVQPIFAARCYECHGPEKQKGGFRADSKTIAFQAGDSGEKPIVPGDPGKSHLLALVRGAKPDEIMPPKGDRLTAKELDLLTRD